MTPLDRCLVEQARCREYLNGPGEDKEGAWQGVTDWHMEEVILMTDFPQGGGVAFPSDLPRQAWEADNFVDGGGCLPSGIPFAGGRSLYPDSSGQEGWWRGTPPHAVPIHETLACEMTELLDAHSRTRQELVSRIPVGPYSHSIHH